MFYCLVSFLSTFFFFCAGSLPNLYALMQILSHATASKQLPNSNKLFTRWSFLFAK